MKVVIALDDSPYAQHVLDLVCKRHWHQDTEFRIVHVMEPLPVADWAGEDMPELEQELRERRQKHAEKVCGDARHRLERHFPDARVHFEIRHGSPKTEIILSATEWEANRILIGAHGRGVCPHNLLGSVSRSVAEQAPCTVEILREKAREKSKETDKPTKAETVTSR